MSNEIIKDGRGGPRQNTGPKPAFGEKTEVIRIPRSLKPTIVSYLDDYKKKQQAPALTLPLVEQNPPPLSLPVYHFKIAAGATTGFASPAQDYELDRLDLNKRYITNPPATHYFNVGKQYDSMVDAGILPGATLIIDRSIAVKHNSVVVAAVDGEFIVKRLYKRAGVIKLLSENKDKNYPPIVFNEGQEMVVFGVVTNAINPI